MKRVDRVLGLAGAALFASLVFQGGCAPRLDGPRASRDTPLAAPARVTQAVSTVSREWFVTQLEQTDDVPTDAFGSHVAIAGKTVVAAAPSIQAVYVFVLAEDGWHQQEKLVPPADFAGRGFGASIAIEGETIVVGATPTSDLPGAAYVYSRSGTTWGAPETLAADDGGPTHAFGSSVAIAGDTVVVGASFASVDDVDLGAAYVFSRSGSTWEQTKKLVPSDGVSGDLFGVSVALSTTTILVGASHWPGDFSGAVYAYSRTDWREQQLRRDPSYSSDEFGMSVALSEDVAVIGAHGHPGPFASTEPVYLMGGAFVYGKSASDWHPSTDLFASDGLSSDNFGQSVALSGSRIMVGAPGARSVYVFDSPTSAVNSDRIGSRGDITDFGDPVALDGDIAVIGTYYGSNGAYVAELLVPDGGACSENSDCRARHCVDGVCCNVACSGACEECSSGACSPVPGSVGTPSCSPYLCGDGGGSCPRRCASHLDCVDDHYCLDQRCVARVSNGGACTEARACVSGTCVSGVCAGTLDVATRCSRADDCESGNCADGYCCDQPCDGQCEACDVRGSRGTCSPVLGTPHGERAPCEGGDGVCGGACDGEHTAGCAYPTRSTPCGSSCADGMQTDSACNGQGACVPDAPYSCESYRCGELTCKTSCDDIADCAEGSSCGDGRCQPGPSCIDEQTVQNPDGGVRPCEPYLCDAGSCAERCRTQDDCTGNTACVGSGHCVLAPSSSGASTNHDGGCSIARPRSLGTPWALWAFSIAAIFAARRAARARRTDPLRTASSVASVAVALILARCGNDSGQTNDARDDTRHPDEGGSDDGGSPDSGGTAPGGGGSSGSSGAAQGGASARGGTASRGGTSARGGASGRSGGGSSGDSSSGRGGRHATGTAGAGEAGGGAAGTPDAGEGGLGGEAGGGSDPGCQDPPSTALCTNDLSRIGTGDFEVKFTIRAGGGGDYAIIGQRDRCDHEYFWSARMVFGGLYVELDDNDQHYSDCYAGVTLNDAQFHRVVMRRTSGILSIVVDCGPPTTCEAPTDFSTRLPPLRNEENDPCIGFIAEPLVGNVTDRCVRPL